MLRRCLPVLLLAVSLLMLFPLAARADVLIEPPDDFYERNRDRCVHHNRSYYINGPDGFITVKTEPGSSSEVTALENGTIVRVMFTYDHHGALWGVIMINGHGSDETGWVPMSQLVLVYDYISFEEEFGAEFYEYTGSYDTLKAAGEIVLWTWPGSGVISYTLDAEIFEFGDSYFRFEDAYTDELGNEWGFIGYWRGRWNAWVCISDPGNRDIPATNPEPEPELTPPAAPVVNNGDDTAALIIIAAVTMAVAVGAAVLIRVLWRKRKN